MTTVLYGRLSTEEQKIEHQRDHAEAAGFQIDVAVFHDGASGATTRLADHPEGRRLFDLLRMGDTLVVRWVDRFGRNYEEVCDNIREFMRRGGTITTVISAFVFDGTTTDPMQKAIRDALIGLMATMGKAQTEAPREAQRAGIARARATQPLAYRGRKPTFTRAQLNAVREMLGRGDRVGAISRATALSCQTIYRIQADPGAAEAALLKWS